MNVDIYIRTPGNNLLGADKVLFDDISKAIDSATHDMLIRPDWEANMRCVDLVGTVRRRDILGEVVFMLRKKLRASEPKVVVMTLKLMESLVNNCGASWHEAMNEDKLMRDVGNIARKYTAKTGADSAEVSEVCLDLVQAWGEAFLPRRAVYPNIVETYFTLRKEGLPFKTLNQFDPSRVPIFAKPTSQEEYLDPQTDAMLAQAIQQSLDVSSKPAASSRPAVTAAKSTRQVPRYTPSPPAESALSLAPRELLDSLLVTLPLLKDMISSANSESDLTDSDFASDIVQQIQSCLGGMNAAIEKAITDPTVLEKLFAVNDDAQCLVSAYQGVQRGTMTVNQAHAVTANTLQILTSASAAAPASVSKPQSPIRTSPDSPLVDFGSYGQQGSPGKPSPRRSIPSAPTPPPPVQTPDYGRAKVSIAPPRSAQASAVPILAPPPSAREHRPSLAGKPKPESCDEIIVQAEDPFAPEALDALFSSKPVKKEVDPFSPEALDALFDTPPKKTAVKDKGKDRDPFSAAALDALFDAPPPPIQAPAMHAIQAPAMHPYPQPSYGMPQQYGNVPPPQGYPQQPPPGYYPQQAQQPRPAYPPQQQQQQQQYPPYPQQQAGGYAPAPYPTNYPMPNMPAYQPSVRGGDNVRGGGSPAAGSPAFPSPYLTPQTDSPGANRQSRKQANPFDLYA